MFTFAYISLVKYLFFYFISLTVHREFVLIYYRFFGVVFLLFLKSSCSGTSIICGVKKGIKTTEVLNDKNGYLEVLQKLSLQANS